MLNSVFGGVEGQRERQTEVQVGADVAHGDLGGEPQLLGNLRLPDVNTASLRLT